MYDLDHKRKVQNEFGAVAKTYEFQAFKRSLGLFYLNQLELDFIRKSLRKPLGIVIDLGTGPGRLTREVCKWGQVQIVGMDISRNMVRVAKRSISIPYVDFLIADIEYLPFRTGGFNAAICIRVLKYASHIRIVQKEIHRVIKCV